MPAAKPLGCTETLIFAGAVALGGETDNQLAPVTVAVNGNDPVVVLTLRSWPAGAGAFTKPPKTIEEGVKIRVFSPTVSVTAIVWLCVPPACASRGDPPSKKGSTTGDVETITFAVYVPVGNSRMT
jgi:hypothetical protein